MAWLKVSFPTLSKVAEALVPVGLACLAGSGFAERGSPVFFAEAFLAFGFFIESSVDIARPNGASIAGGTTTVNQRRATWNTADVFRCV
jgi:hypothetical protein